MLAYKLNMPFIHNHIRERAKTPHEELLHYIEISRYSVLTRHALGFYGIDDLSIAQMVESGFLLPVEISPNEATSITLQHRYRTDPNYRAVCTAALQAGRAAQDPSFHKHAIKRAHDTQMKKIHARRKRLASAVLAPRFGYRKDGDVSVSIMDVVEAVREVRSLYELYPKSIYLSVMYDLRDLGVPTEPASVRLKRTWQQKLGDNPILAENLRRRALNMTSVRQDIYRRDPERAAKNYRKMVDARLKKLKEDPAFHRATMKCLRMGRPAFDRKYKNDMEFRDEVDRNRLTGLQKGLKTIKKRAAKRRQALARIAKRVFGDVYDASPGRLADYLESNRPSFIDIYFRNGLSYDTVKKDLAFLRRAAA